MSNMTVIEFPESPRLKRLREILDTAKRKMEQVDGIQEDINALMFEYELLQLEIAPFEVIKLANHIKIPEQLEFNF